MCRYHRRTASRRVNGSDLCPDVYDVLIIGAGPAGISASLRAIEHKLNYITLERDEIGAPSPSIPGRNWS